MVTAAVWFLGAAAAIVLVGPRMARVGDRLSAATGMGGALFGVVFLALATDLPELALTPAAVIGGTPRIAVGGLLGSAAAQLLLIAVLDVVVRDAPLYTRSPTRTALAQTSLMTAVLAVAPVVAPIPAIWSGIGVGTVLLPLTYVWILRGIRAASLDDAPKATAAAENEDVSVASLWLRFGLAALILGASGVVLEATTESIGSSLGLGHTASGALLAGIVTSLPELVTAISAVRLGAIALAMGNLIGSSALDVTLLAVGDVFLRSGSIFALLGPPEYVLIGLALALTALVMLALARRREGGPWNVATESYLMFAAYGGSAMILAFTPDGS